ncbi:MAG: amidohydrolase family protein [Oscillospiraceae bacterium]
MKILIKNACAILPDGYDKNCAVAISDGSIVAVGTAPADFKADRTIDARGQLLTPGFVNAHTHNHMTALRNRADDLPFTDWLFKNVMPMEDTLTPAEAYYSVQLAIMELLLSGTTCFLDMHMFPEAFGRATLDSGMRAVLSRGLTGGAEDTEGGARRIREMREDIARFRGEELLSFMVGPHAPYTCDEAYLKETAALAEELGVGIHTHLSESEDEQKTIRERYGCTPAEFYGRCGILRENTVCAHCVQLSESDMALLASRGCSVVHNAASNMKLGNGFADVPAMLAHGINVCLGTDSAASNNSLSMLREMELVSLIHKGTHRDATAVSAYAVFDMATKNGSKALGLGGKTGEIKAGMRADLALFPMDSIGFFPVGDPKAALCYSSAGLRADTVLVNGNILLEHGEFKTIDAERVKYEIGKLDERLTGKEENV